MSSNRRVISSTPARLGSLAIIAVGITALFPGASSAAQAPIGLGTAGAFAVLAGQGITNANATTIIGDVGSFPNPAETGFGTVTLTGTNHHGDAVSQNAKNDLVTAYNQAAGSGPPTAVAVELGGTTLKPGVYNGATLEITGTLTLDTQGNPNAVFVFQSGSTLITAANSAVTVLSGATACNVFWKVPSSATLGTNSHLIGTVLASTAIAATSGATVQGRLLAATASVTLDHNTITAPGCTAGTTAGAGGPTTVASGGPTTVASGGPTTVALGGSPGVVRGGSATNAGPPAATSRPPGGSTRTGTPRSPATPAGPTPPTGPRPPLARTGFDGPMPLIGATAVMLGLLLLGLSRTSRPHVSRANRETL